MRAFYYLWASLQRRNVGELRIFDGFIVFLPRLAITFDVRAGLAVRSMASKLA